MKPFIALALIGRFLWEIVASGVTTAWVIVRPGGRPKPGIVRLVYGDLSPRGAVILGGMITLTPGTTTIDIDLERHELLVHLLDTTDPEASAREIRERFERKVERLFPARRSP